MRRLTKTQHRTIAASEPTGHGRVVATLLADLSVVYGEVREVHRFVVLFLTDENLM